MPTTIEELVEWARAKEGAVELPPLCDLDAWLLIREISYILEGEGQNDKPNR